MKITPTSHRLLAFLALAPLLFTTPGQAQELTCQERLDHWIDAADLPLLHYSNFSRLREPVARLYGSERQQPLWFQADGATSQALTVAERLSSADAKGLDKAFYDGDHWREWLASPETLSVAEQECRRWLADLAFSVSVMRYVSDLRVGRVDPKRLKYNLDVASKRYDLAAFLLELAGSAEPGALLDRAEPPFQHYRALLAALERYRELAQDPELNRPLPVTKKSLRPGEPYPELQRLAYRLERWGDLQPQRPVAETAVGQEQEPAAEPQEQVDAPVQIYDGGLVEGVKRFQQRHGLLADGVVGRKTFAELNVPMTERVEQIRLTLERWRWMPDRLGHRPIVINVPEFKLYAFEDDGKGGYQQALDMQVIVGEAYPKHQTPLFRSAMRYVVFSPYWNVPYNILKRELYDKIEEDPGYLAEHNYQIVNAFHPGATVFPPEPENISRLITGELKLRQTPGAHNALGAAKFIFPNYHAVYLHGTPAMRLFKKDRRDFSHGCIRVADPPRLAEYVLKEKQGWDRERVDALIAKGEWRQVSLAAPLDVYVLYGTAVADLDGTVHFFRDIYGHDKKLAHALVQAVEASATARTAKRPLRSPSGEGRFPSAIVQVTSDGPGQYPGE